MCLCVFVHVSAVSLKARRRRWIRGTRVSSGCEPLCGCLELNSCPLQEQQMHPTSEVPLHLQTSAYLQGKRHYTCCKATILYYGDVFLLGKEIDCREEVSSAPYYQDSLSGFRVDIHAIFFLFNPRAFYFKSKLSVIP